MMDATLRSQSAASRRLRRVPGLIAVCLVYALVTAAVVFALYRSGGYPAGRTSDAMFYVYRGDFLYRSITQDHVWPLMDMSWYNGVETWRYWSPLSAVILALCQGVMGGSAFQGYLLFAGIFCMLNGLVWLWIGCTHGRPWLGSFLGLIWFLLPANSYLFFAEGVLARSMSMVVVPLYVVSLYDYLYRPLERRWPTLLRMLLSYTVILMSHVGQAGMLAFCVVIYLIVYLLLHVKREDRVSVGPILVCMILAFLLTGVWLVPSLQGGITSMDSSSIMRNYFQSLNDTLNPFRGWLEGGSWNRWKNYPDVAYFGLAPFLLAVFGLLFSKRRHIPGFFTGLAVCLLTSTAAYPILSLAPGGQYLWMLRFLPLAATFVVVSFFFWRTLKKGWVVCFALLLSVHVLLSLGLVTRDGVGATPEAAFDTVAQQTLIQEGKEITHQRMSLVEPFTSNPMHVYTTAGYGERTVATSYGQGIQAAVNANNLVQINQAAQDGQYLYLFDRLLELGNDSVIVPFRDLDPRYADAEVLDQAAAQVGYALVDSTDDFRLYHLADAPDTFGVVTKYRAIAIGKGSAAIALSFPAVEETDGIYLDEYTFDDLHPYDVIYLSGFSYHSVDAAEKLVLDLSEAGSRIIIMADGMPSDEHTGSKSFLGVSCNTVNFQNGYPALDTIDGVLICDLFADGYSKDWKTVYVNGLDQVWGTITDVPEGKMDFYGTAKNDNIVFIGLALTYHYSLTLDQAVGDLLSHALDLSPRELPHREVVPITLDCRGNVITVDAPRDNVNITLSLHDIFRSDRELRAVNHMTVVDQGRTTIRLVYPCLIPGLGLTALGLVLTVGYLILSKKRLNKLIRLAREAQPEPVPEPVPQPEPVPPPQSEVEMAPEASQPEASQPEAPPPPETEAEPQTAVGSAAAPTAPEAP